MNRSSKNRKKLGIALAILIVALSLSPPVRQISEIPRDLTLLKGKAEKLEVGYPFTIEVRGESKDSILVDDKSMELKPIELGEISLEFRLFGYIPLRTVDVDIISPIELIPGGNAVGIKLKPTDTMIVGFHEIETIDGYVSPGKEAGLKQGDAIIKIEGNKVGNVEKTAEILSRYYETKEEIEILIDRNGKKKAKIVKPDKCQESKKFYTGLYIRDTKAGVGTLTYIDPENKRFGALGHSISESNAEEPIEIKNGQIVSSNIVDIKRGKENNPGEKRGTFIENKAPVGLIDKNTTYGIFGDKNKDVDMDNLYYQEPIPVGMVQHVEEGPAEILTVIEGQKVESFDIEITRVMPENYKSNKGMVIEVVDPELLEKTNGIIQGMSGSPIIQDEKLVGCVTHVFMNNPSKGYGAYMERMLYESGEI